MRGLKKDMMTGGGLITSGYVFDLLIQEFGPEAIINVGFPVSSYIISSTVLGEYIQGFFVDWIAEEGAEQVVGEILEAVAIALSGIGLVFTGYKLFKYGRLVDRLLIKKEPLQQMRVKIKENTIENLKTIEEEAIDGGEKCFDSAFDLIQNTNESLLKQLKVAQVDAINRNRWAQSFIDQ